MDKRQFLKTAFYGTGGIFCIGNPLKLIASSQKSSYIGTKWCVEALYYTQTPKGLLCQICPNECTIKEGESGDCRNHVNYKGKLYSIAYGNPCAVHVDPIEKKPLLHFLPASKAFSIATAGCNLACLNCQNWTISQSSPDETDNYDLLPEKVVENCISKNCDSIAYTYSEPITFYEYTYDSAKLAKEAGIKNVMVTAGYIHKDPLLKLCKVIDAANVDLKSFSNEIYLKLNAGKLQPVLDTLITMKENGVWLEITNLVVPSWTDDFDMIKRMCNWLVENNFEYTPLNFSRFQPLYKLTNLPPTPINTLKKARDIALAEGLKHVYIGNVPGIGAENTFCPKCSKMVVERRGYRILQNHIINSKCEYCNEIINGIWEK
ncbi:MAG: AmmeMemoRadiSam system radical SAM enzyme [Salinivirgaceae bacterium]|nr:AmmeMemoRadiSam system radical SAM enzyme [Salinivirgaceae bacterium]